MLAQGATEIGLEGHQGPGNAQAHGAALAVHASAIGGNDDVPLLIRAGNREGLLGYHFADGVLEIVGEGAIVDDALAGSRADDDAGDGVLAPARGLELIAGGILRCDGGPPLCVVLTG